MTIAVRPAGVADSAVVGEIHAESWSVAYAPFFEPDFAAGQIADRRIRWTDRLRAGGVLLGTVGGRPLAFSWAGPSPSRAGIAELYGFYGHPDGWGSGVAAALMAETLAVVRAGGYDRVHLWTMRDTPQSRRFYAKSGFVETGAFRDHDFGDGRPLVQVEYERAL
ncbi:N-acetyltransferase family protein [Pseudonocardia sp. CA-107938]|uniref:GNAT family N-acetyltransferase n=1 Tax=Pseudonocardia sp. CA-107938 TaxID=3240021 RepID=UPI003D8C25F1